MFSHYSDPRMTPSEGMPWRPQRLDALLEEPFDQMSTQQANDMLARLGEMLERLTSLEAELDELTERALVS